MPHFAYHICTEMFKDHIILFHHLALAIIIRVLTSSIGARVRRFFGFVLGCCREGFSWWCVWVSVHRFFGFVLGGNRFLQCNDAKVFFRVCHCFAS